MDNLEPRSKKWQTHKGGKSSWQKLDVITKLGCYNIANYFFHLSTSFIFIHSISISDIDF